MRRRELSAEPRNGIARADYGDFGRDFRATRFVPKVDYRAQSSAEGIRWFGARRWSADHSEGDWANGIKTGIDRARDRRMERDHAGHEYFLFAGARASHTRFNGVSFDQIS